MTRTQSLAAAIGVIGIAIQPALAQAPRVSVTQAWARATVGTSNGAVYLTLTDHGAADQLIGVSTPVAGMAQLHEDKVEGGIMRMRPVATLPLPPGKPVTLAPGGYHLMLMGLVHPLRRGDSFPLTVTFAHAPAATVQVRVEGPGTTQPGSPAATPGLSDAMPGMAMAPVGSSASSTQPSPAR